MEKGGLPQEYVEVQEVLGTLYDEVDGCSFYEYIFPNNQRYGQIGVCYEQPNAVYLYMDERDRESKRRLRRRIMFSDTCESVNHRRI